MKVVHIIWSFNTGGAETMLIDIINEQMKYENISLIVVNKVLKRIIGKNLQKTNLSSKEKSKYLLNNEYSLYT